MPMYSLLSTPPPLCRGQATEPSHASIWKNTRKKLARNVDKELLQHVQEARCHNKNAAAVRGGGGAGPGVAPPPSLPYSKDFGSFELTLCLAGDGRCVVLVEYEERVFVNGRQVYVRDDGKLLDRLGRYNDIFQTYYDCAVEAKKRLKGTESSGYEQKGFGISGNSPENIDRVLDEMGGQDLLEENHGVTFESELTELEASFGSIIARFCKIIVDVIGRETADSECAVSSVGDASTTSRRHRSQLQTAISRLSDQFQSVAELSESLFQPADSDDPATKKNTRLGNRVAPALRQLRVDTSDNRDLPGAITEQRMDFKGADLVAKPHLLWEENQKLRSNISTLKTELQQLELLHKKVEDQFFEVESTRVDVANQLASTTAENAALRKQLALATKKAGKGRAEKLSPEVKSATSLLSRLANRLSGSSSDKHVPTADVPSALTVTSSNDDEEDDPERSPDNVARDQTAPRHGMQALDRQQNLRSEIKRLREVYENMEDNVQSYGEKNRSLRMRIHKMERERKELKDNIRDTGNILEDRSREVENLDTLNSQLNVKCCNLTSEKAALGAEVDRLSARCAETGSRMRSLERELTELGRSHEGAEAEKRQCRDRLDLVNEAHLAECNKTSKLLKEKASMEEQLSQLRHHEGELQAEVDRLKVENSANGEGRLNAENVMKRLELDFQTAAKCRAELEDEVRHLRRKLAKSETDCKSMKKENARFESQCTKLTEEVNGAKASAEDLYLNKRMLEEEKAYLQEVNRELQKENAELQEAISGLTDANEGIRAKMRRWGRDNVSMQGKMRKLIHAKSELHGVIKQLSTVNSDIETRFEKMDGEYAALESRLSKKAGQTVPFAVDTEATLTEDVKRALIHQPSSGHSRQEDDRKRSSCKAVADLKHQFAELEKELLLGGSTNDERKKSPNDITFVSACSDFDSGSSELGLWWDNTVDGLNTSLDVNDS